MRVVTLIFLALSFMWTGAPWAEGTTKPPATFLVVGNGPTKFDSRKDYVAKEFTKLIDGAPKGSTIRIAVYLWNMEDPTRAIERAVKRGVHVRIALDIAMGWSNPIKRLDKAAKSDKSQKSLLFRPTGSGLSPYGTLHAKIATFSKTGSRTNVVVTGSGNFAYDSNVRSSWNITDFYDDDVLYAGAWKFIEAIIANKPQPKYYKNHVVASRGVRLMFAPGTSQVVLSRIRDFNSRKRCKGVTIRAVVFQWSNAHVQVAKASALRRAGAMGCRVQVIVNYKRSRDLFGVDVYDALMKPYNGRRVVSIHNGRTPDEYVNVGTGYVHGKYAMFEKRVKGKVSRTEVYSGSMNWLSKSETNADVLTLNRDPKVHTAYLSQFNKIWNMTKPITTRPVYKPMSPASEADAKDTVE